MIFLAGMGRGPWKFEYLATINQLASLHLPHLHTLARYNVTTDRIVGAVLLSSGHEFNSD